MDDERIFSWQEIAAVISFLLPVMMLLAAILFPSLAICLPLSGIMWLVSGALLASVLRTPPEPPPAPRPKSRYPKPEPEPTKPLIPLPMLVALAITCTVVAAVQSGVDDLTNFITSLFGFSFLALTVLAPLIGWHFYAWWGDRREDLKDDLRRGYGGLYYTDDGSVVAPEMLDEYLQQRQLSWLLNPSPRTHRIMIGMMSGTLMGLIAGAIFMAGIVRVLLAIAALLVFIGLALIMWRSWRPAQPFIVETSPEDYEAAQRFEPDA